MKPRHSHPLLAAIAPDELADRLGVARTELDIRRDDRSGADFVIKTLGKTFVVEFKAAASAAPIAAAARQAAQHARGVSHSAIPLLVVPFMGDVGRRVCEEAGVAWIDLSGNARIVAPGLRVIVEGGPNRFLHAGRPSSAFAPKSTRIARWLLIHPHEAFAQREIAKATEMGEGFVSRIVGRLEKEGYVRRLDPGGGYGRPVGNGDGYGNGEYGEGSSDGNGYGDGRGKARSHIMVRDPDLLLDALRNSYQFSKHAVLRGHVAARSGDALLRFANDVLSERGIDHAATGLAAAWALTRFAAFRLATIYLRADPQPDVIERLGFREDARGANLWLVVPNDAGVFHGAAEKDGVLCVHPVQVYLDLKEQPERAKEAAERLRADLLNWRRDG